MPIDAVRSGGRKPPFGVARCPETIRRAWYDRLAPAPCRASRDGSKEAPSVDVSGTFPGAKIHDQTNMFAPRIPAGAVVADEEIATLPDETQLRTDGERPQCLDAPRARPPVADIEPQAVTLHGETLVDEYRWLRDRDDPRVLAYLEAENAYTEAMTAHTETLRERLYEEMVGRIRETDLSVPVEHGGWRYYARTEAGLQYKIYCRRGVDAAAGDEQILLDLNAIARDGGHAYLRLGIFEVSPDHRMLAYGLDTEGTEDYVLRFVPLDTGPPIEDELSGLGASFAWANDGRTVFYTVRDSARRPFRVLRHRLGQDTAEDEVVYEDLDERFYVDVGQTRSRRFIVAGSSSSVTSEIHLLDADQPLTEFRPFAPRRAGVEYDVDHHGDFLYVRTNAGAKNFKLMRTRLEDWSEDAWDEIVPARDDVKLEDVEPFASHLVLIERRAGLRALRILDPVSGRGRTLEMPEVAYALFRDQNPDYASTRYRFQYTSPVTPRTVYEVDLASGERFVLKRDEVLGGYESSNYDVERLYARARDGVAIPVTLLFRRGLVRDGSRPCLLYGYGAYGASIDPAFSSARLSLVDRGVTFAIAHVRGGGALGESWHEGGRMLAKPTSFDDFVDVAEHLVSQRYTARDRLVAKGGSAGGLLVGAVINRRPDLFRAAVAEVPFVDVINTMLDESMPLTVGEFEEWGNPKDETYFRCMRSYSPYDNVAEQIYPALLVTAGLHDPRVQYWEPAKWTARLRARAANGDDVLLRTNMGAGHGGASGRYEALREYAFELAFILDRLGLAS